MIKFNEKQLLTHHPCARLVALCCSRAPQDDSAVVQQPGDHCFRLS